MRSTAESSLCTYCNTHTHMHVSVCVCWNRFILQRHWDKWMQDICWQRPQCCVVCFFHFSSHVCMCVCVCVYHAWMCLKTKVGEAQLSVGEELIIASLQSHLSTKAWIHINERSAHTHPHIQRQRQTHAHTLIPRKKDRLTHLPCRVKGMTWIKFVLSVFRYFHCSCYTISPDLLCLLPFPFFS